MKIRIILLALFCVSIWDANAQTKEQEAAFEKLQGKFQLDDDFGYSYTRVFEDLNATKEELYTKALAAFPYLVKDTYDARKIIQHESIEEGVIIAKVALSHIGEYSNLAHHYIIHSTPIIRIDLKDNRMRMIVSIKKLFVYHRNASGIFVTEQNEEIPSTNLPPFVPDKKKKVNEMYYRVFFTIYNTVENIFAHFDKGLREGNTGEKESKDDW